MATFLTDEWVDLVLGAASELDSVEGISAVVQFEFTGGSEGKAHVVATIDNGQITAFALGKQRGPDCTVAVEQAIAAQVFAGTLDPRVAYMRGDIKLGGSYSTVLYDMGPIYDSPGAKRFWQSMTTSTIFPT